MSPSETPETDASDENGDDAREQDPHAARAAGAASDPDDDEAVDAHPVAVMRSPGSVELPPRRTGVFLDPRDLRQHVGELLRTTLGGYEVDPAGNFTFTHEGARVFVTVGASQVGPQVGVFSITNVGVDLTAPLAGFLVTTNHRLGFGAFSYDTQNKAVWLRHSLLGTMLDGPELQTAVLSVAATAAHFDGVITQRFGGRTFGDATSEEQQTVRPPEPTDDPDEAINASGYL